VCGSLDCGADQILRTVVFAVRKPGGECSSGISQSVEATKVKRGLNHHARRRALTINKLIRDALVPLLASSQCKFVFTALTHRRQPLSVEKLGGQARDMKRRGQFHADAGLHGLRHTFFTQLGTNVDVFTVMRIADHTSIKTTEKYVHPQRSLVREEFVVNMAVVAESPQKTPQCFAGSP